MILTQEKIKSMIEKSKENNFSKDSQEKIKASINNQIDQIAISRKFSNYILNDKNLMIRYKIFELKNLRKKENDKNIKDFYSLMIKDLKKSIIYDTGLLEFNSFYELDLFTQDNKTYPFNGLDVYIMYLLKWIKNYNYQRYCDTYQISINDLRSQVNLQLMSRYLKDYLIELDLLKVNSFSELTEKNQINQIKYWIIKKVRIILRDYCTLLSLPIYIPNNKVNRYRQIKKMSSFQNTINFLNSRDRIKEEDKSNTVKIQISNRFVSIRKSEKKKKINLSNLKLAKKKLVNHYIIRSRKKMFFYDYYKNINNNILSDKDLKNLSLPYEANYIIDVKSMIEKFNLLLLKQIYFDKMSISSLKQFYHCSQETLKKWENNQMEDLKSIIENRLLIEKM